MFRPSGTVRLLEARSVEPAIGDVAVWAKRPRPTAGCLDPRKLRQPQGPRSGVSALFGQWPGEETDNDITTALQSLA